MSNITFNDIRIVVGLFPAIAYVVTTARVAIRFRRLWWDDAWAGFSMLCLIVLEAITYVHLMDPTQVSQFTKVAVYYLSCQFFYAVVWSARFSILFSVIRITPTPTMKKLLIGVAFLFGVIWAVLFAQVFWICENQPGWKDALVPQCALGEQVAIAQIITDTVADILLILAPAWDLRHVMDKGLRRRLIAIFSTSIMTTIVSLAHAIIVIKVGGLQEALAALLEDSISLIVCNLSVIITAIYRLFKPSHEVIKSGLSANPGSVSVKFQQSRKPTSTFTPTMFQSATVVEDGSYKGKPTTVDESRLDASSVEEDQKAGGLVCNVSYEMSTYSV